jgi:hypothetical protein
MVAPLGNETGPSLLAADRSGVFGFGQIRPSGIAALKAQNLVDVSDRCQRFSLLDWN